MNTRMTFNKSVDYMDDKNNLVSSFRTNYIYSDEENYHQDRTKYILKNYPQVKQWIRPYPLSALYTFFLLLLQVGLAIVLANQSWWLIIMVAFFVGAIASHSLFVLLHDSVHKLIFKNKIMNKWMIIFINLGQGFPSGISFERYHLMHHAHFSDYDLDLDVPLVFEAKAVKNHPFRKAIWLFFLGLIQALRPIGKQMMFFDAWMCCNLVSVVLFNVLLTYFFGWSALLYILMSTFFGLGFFHPLGARWVQEHFVFREGQATYSYYGIGNKFSFNIGYHNEHHDLMGIPWIHLPKLKKMIPELYEPFYSHKSWIKLYFRTIFDRRITLFDRIVKQRT